jgi:hypothetical protein
VPDVSLLLAAQRAARTAQDYARAERFLDPPKEYLIK